MSQVIEFVNFNGIGVPRCEDGRFYDWRGKDIDNPPQLHSPYGPLHFSVGSSRTVFYLNYAEMPDGQYIVEVVEPFPILHIEDVYNLRQKADIVETAYYLTCKILEVLESVGEEHDMAWHGADAWYFMRAVAHEAGSDRFKLEELRFGGLRDV